MKRATMLLFTLCLALMIIGTVERSSGQDLDEAHQEDRRLPEAREEMVEDIENRVQQGADGILPQSYQPEDEAQREEMPEDGVARGEYIVHHVAMCVQCHTSRDRGGNLLDTELLKGAPIPVEGPRYVDEWAVRAPAIAGLPGYNRQQAMQLLTEGVTSRGGPPSPPMPPFRMSEEDASAVIDYLKSL